MPIVGGMLGAYSGPDQYTTGDGQAAGDLIGQNMDAGMPSVTGASKTCSFVMDFGGTICVDPAEAPGLVDSGTTVAQDAAGAVARVGANIGQGITSAVQTTEKGIQAIGSWAIVVLALALVLVVKVKS